MTTIAAKKTATGVSVAWDAQVTSGNRASSTEFSKVVKVNDQFLVGATGHVRYANLIHRAQVDPIHTYDLSQPGFDGLGWLTDTLVPAWMKAIRNAQETHPAEDKAEVPDGVALIVLAGEIYTVGWDYSVSNNGDFQALGSGSDFAVAAMHLGKSAKKAVEVAAELDLYTGGNVKELIL